MADPSDLMARLVPNVPFPFTSAFAVRSSKELFGERRALPTIKQEVTPERKPTFRFESLATEFETMEENDSGIGTFLPAWMMVMVGDTPG